MKKIISNDGTETFFDEVSGESYHSNTGAVEEAVKKFVEPTLIYLKGKKNLKILDICFGLGYNSAAAIDTWNECEIVAIEKDEKIISEIENVNPPFHCYVEIKELTCKKKTKHINLIVGDVLEEIDNLEQESFDVIFLDPFSPKKAPELWSAEFMKKIYNKMKEGGVLTTYSCASLVRNNLRIAGFEVFDGPCIKRRGPSTVAIKK